jgi:hypothetical protein
MYCTIVFTKDGFPKSVKVQKKGDSLIFEVDFKEVSIPIENIQRVLDFFK